MGDARINPAQLAAEIRADHERRRGRPVVLIVCHSGTDRRNGFAAQLARELPGTRIIAPDGVVWAGPAGHAIVTGHDRRGRDGEALIAPAGTTGFVEFEASPTDPGHLTVTDLPPVLDANTPVGAVDADRTARSVAQLSAWAQSHGTEVKSRTQPVIDALASALDNAVSAERHEQLTDLLVETDPQDRLVAFSAPGNGSDETTAGEAAPAAVSPAEIGTAPPTEGDVALPTPEEVRAHLPAYLRDSRTLGIAEQLRATRDTALGVALRTLDPRLPADVVATAIGEQPVTTDAELVAVARAAAAIHQEVPR